MAAPDRSRSGQNPAYRPAPLRFLPRRPAGPKGRTFMRLRDLRVPVLVVLAVALTLLPAQAAPRPAPPFSLELFNGKTLTLDSLRGKAGILLFWAPWGITCNRDAP